MSTLDKQFIKEKNLSQKELTSKLAAVDPPGYAGLLCSLVSKYCKESQSEMLQAALQKLNQKVQAFEKAEKQEEETSDKAIKAAVEFICSISKVLQRAPNMGGMGKQQYFSVAPFSRPPYPAD